MGDPLRDQRPHHPRGAGGHHARRPAAALDAGGVLSSERRASREGRAAPPEGEELSLYAVVAAGRSARSGGPFGGGEPIRIVEAGGLGAVVSRVPARRRHARPEAVRAHERIVERLLARRAVVPFPPGLRARDEAAVRRLLERQRMALEEALATLADTYEIRLHARVREVPPAEAREDDGVRKRDGPGSPGGHVRLERLLGRLSRLAVSSRPLPRAPEGAEKPGDSSHAFLVDRSGWISFVEEATGSADETGELELDATGPWPPYDFVRLVPAAEQGGT